MLIDLSPPSAPFGASDALLRQMLRLDVAETDEDTLIDGLIVSAVARAEAFTRRRFLTQTVRLVLDDFCGDEAGRIALPVTPIQSVDQIEYTDTDGVDQVLASTEYKIQRSGVGELLVPEYEKSWPSVRSQGDAVRVDLVVGYGDDAADIPADILHAIRLDVAHKFTIRESVVLGDSVAELPMGARDHLNSHRVWY